VHADQIRVMVFSSVRMLMKIHQVAYRAHVENALHIHNIESTPQNQVGQDCAIIAPIKIGSILCSGVATCPPLQEIFRLTSLLLESAQPKKHVKIVPSANTVHAQLWYNQYQVVYELFVMYRDNFVKIIFNFKTYLR
jgi:hypothetical protein